MLFLDSARKITGLSQFVFSSSSHWAPKVKKINEIGRCRVGRVTCWCVCVRLVEKVEDDVGLRIGESK
jgi:hypothetical protein